MEEEKPKGRDWSSGIDFNKVQKPLVGDFHIRQKPVVTRLRLTRKTIGVHLNDRALEQYRVVSEVLSAMFGNTNISQDIRDCIATTYGYFKDKGLIDDNDMFKDPRTPLPDTK